MKFVRHVFEDFEAEPRRPGVCFLFGIGNSRSSSSVTNLTETTTENTAIDNRIAATDNAVIVGQDGSFTVTNNSATDSRDMSDRRDQSVTVGDGMFVGSGGTLNVLDGGAIDLAKDAAEIAARAARDASDAAVRAARETTDALRAGYDGSLRTLRDVNESALGFGRSVVDQSLDFGSRIAQSNEDLTERAIVAVMNTAKDAAAQSGGVVNRALDSLLQADQSSEERAFGNITAMVKTVAIAAAVAVGIWALARYSK